MNTMQGTLKAIVAICDDWGIGLSGDMIVANRVDMRHFVRCTTGHTVIMGRKTLESFPGARPLKDRRNIVLTRNASYAPKGVIIAHSVDAAIALLEPGEEAWVIGGADVYQQFLPFCSEVVVTKNHCVRNADAYFPNLDDDPAWSIESINGGHIIAPGEGDVGIAFDFVTYVRRGAAR